MAGDIAHKVGKLQGPILVLGASGFIGANLLRMLLGSRQDVFGTAGRLPAWRLEGLAPGSVRALDLLVESNLDALLDELRPRTVFNCVAFGAYSFETASPLIYETNFAFTARLLERLSRRGVASYVHAGSSSEYGDHAAAPKESAAPTPNSDYAVSKVAAAAIVYYHGKKRRLPAAHLRLYSVYGPYEDSARLIPNVIRHGVAGKHPAYVDPNISRDFIYVDDACEAFLDAALELREEAFGEAFNIGTGRMTTIADVAARAAETFAIGDSPAFTMPSRQWDVGNWYADVAKARTELGFEARTTFAEGLRRTADWYRGLADPERYHGSSKQFALDTKHSVTAIIACYRDGQAIPILYERLKTTFGKLSIDYEIIFVNDCSPDDSEEVIRAISRQDRRVLGISHSRNFGSQAAFRSGMEIATKNSCVLLDGDLQDPPELIEAFVGRWREGYDVVFGRRVKREASFVMQLAYKAFYRVFEKFSYLSIPRDAGDFSLLDRRVVQAMLRFPERDLFLRGVRAFAGFRQIGVDYVRPERMFGRTTNSFLKNIGWAKKGILSFSNVPLNMLSAFASLLVAASIGLSAIQIVSKLLFPDSAPRGITTTLLVLTFFGSVNLFAISLIGEYIAKIFEESKQRPLFIRRSIIRGGEIRAAADDVPHGERP